MPQELINRDYCKLLYTTRCKPKSINDNKIPAFKLLPEDLAFDSYVKDFHKSHKKDKSKTQPNSKTTFFIGNYLQNLMMRIFYH